MIGERINPHLHHATVRELAYSTSASEATPPSSKLTTNSLQQIASPSSAIFHSTHPIDLRTSSNSRRLAPKQAIIDYGALLNLSQTEASIENSHQQFESFLLTLVNG